MSRLQKALDDYLAIRRSVGFKLRNTEYLLRDYVAHLDQQGATTITTASALSWAKRPTNVDPHHWGERLTAVRGFAKYLHTMDAAVEVPPAGLLVTQRRRTAPYLYTEHDVAGLITAAGWLRPAFRAATYRTLVGLLAVSGMRVGELIRLDDCDLNWGDGLLIVRSSKFGRSREVVLHKTTIEALQAYERERARLRPAPSAFFVSTVGTRLIYTCVQRTFRHLVQVANIGVGATGRPPRLHDLRHTFAVNTVVDWYRAGVDLEGQLYRLSTYLGHVDPKDTYWYMSAVPELLALVSARLEQTLGDLP